MHFKMFRGKGVVSTWKCLERTLLTRWKFYLDSSSSSRAIKYFTRGMYTIYSFSNKNKASTCLSVLTVSLYFRSWKLYVFRLFHVRKGSGGVKKAPHPKICHIFSYNNDIWNSYNSFSYFNYSCAEKPFFWQWWN